VLRHVASWRDDTAAHEVPAIDKRSALDRLRASIASVFAHALPEMWRRRLAALRSSLIGF
jgi:hypothetical protein